MLDTRDRHGASHLHTHTRTSGSASSPPLPTSGAMEGSRPQTSQPQAQLQHRQAVPRYGVTSSGSSSSSTSSSPEAAMVVEDEDDYYTRGGEKKDRVKQVGRGRKRRLDEAQQQDADAQLLDVGHSLHSFVTPKSSSPIGGAKRARTHDDAPEEKQSAGCTDEGLEEQQQLIEEEDADEDDDAVPHPPPRTWVAKAEWALGRLGGKGTLADIYATIEEAFPEEIDGKRNWKAAIRSCLSKNEKNKFFKPEAHAAMAKGDHVWCLAPSSSSARRSSSATITKRGRPAGRSRRSASASASAASSVPTPRRGRGRSRSIPVFKEEEEEEEENNGGEELVQFAVPVAPAAAKWKNGEQRKSEANRLEELLRQKHELEQDISRLQEEVNEDGLSADQEDFLSQLLG